MERDGFFFFAVSKNFWNKSSSLFIYIHINPSKYRKKTINVFQTPRVVILPSLVISGLPFCWYSVQPHLQILVICREMSVPTFFYITICFPAV